MSFKFQKKAALIAASIFSIELLIALYATGFLRHFVGDILVVALLFFCVKTFLNFHNDYLIVCSIFMFSVIIELLQLFKIANYLGITNKVLLIVLGNTFDLLDLAAYAIGSGMLIIMIKLKWV